MSSSGDIAPSANKGKMRICAASATMANMMAARKRCTLLDAIVFHIHSQLCTGFRENSIDAKNQNTYLPPQIEPEA
jgi:hypothetical protein